MDGEYMVEVDWENESGRWSTPKKATCLKLCKLFCLDRYMSSIIVFLPLVIDWDCFSLGCEYQIVVPWFSAIAHGEPAISNSI